MASGFQASAELAAGVTTLVWTVPAGVFFETLNIRYANDSDNPVTVLCQIGSGASPANKDKILPHWSIAGHAPFEDTAKCCSPGEKIWITANLAGVSVRIDGVEAV